MLIVILEFTIGKTTIAVYGMCYVLHRLMCLKKPQAFYSLANSDPIVFVFFNVSLDQSYGVAYKKFQTALMMSPWFLEHGEVTGLQSKVYHPSKNIEFRVGSQTNHSIGQNVFCVTGDTQILTDKGYISAEELSCHDNGELIASYNVKSGLIEYSDTTVESTKHTMELISITLADGSVIKVTDYHPLLLKNGSYKLAKDLTIDDELADIII